MPIFFLQLTLATLQDPVPGTTVFDEATRAARAGNFKAALPLFERAASAAEANKDVRLLARSLSGVGWAQWGPASTSRPTPPTNARSGRRSC